MLTTTEQLLQARAASHGEYPKFCDIFIPLLDQIMRHAEWDGLSNVEKTNLIMTQFKAARAINSPKPYRDNYDDIAGYATLAAKTIPNAID